MGYRERENSKTRRRDDYSINSAPLPGRTCVPVQFQVRRPVKRPLPQSPQQPRAPGTPGGQQIGPLLAHGCLGTSPQWGPSVTRLFARRGVGPLTCGSGSTETRGRRAGSRWPQRPNFPTGRAAHGRRPAGSPRGPWWQQGWQPVRRSGLRSWWHGGPGLLPPAERRGRG